MMCPLCQDEMEMIGRELSVSTLFCESVYSCNKCRIGIQTTWSLFELEGDE